MSYENAPRRPATIFNDFKYPMPRSTKPVNGAKYPATWTWELGAKGNKVFFKVNDGFFGKDDPNAKLKEIDLDGIDRGELFYLMREAANNPSFTATQLPILRQRYNKSTGSYNEKSTVEATFTIMRSKNTGEIRVHFSRMTYEVTFVMSAEQMQVKTRNDAGEFVLDPGLASRAYTNAFVNMSERFLADHEFMKYSREAKGGNQKTSTGNNSRDNDNTSDYNDFDDDF